MLHYRHFCNFVTNQPRSFIVNTTKMITQATLSLMRKYPFGEITVTMICQEADVSRQTFYRKFKDKTEVIESYFTELSLDFTTSFTPSKTDYKANLTNLFTNLPYPADVLKLLLDNNLFYVAEKAFCKICKNNICLFNAKILNDKYLKYHIDFIASTISSIIRLWIEGGMQETKEELAKLAIIFFKGSYEFSFSEN